jgi:hypothetical protein
MISTHLSHGLGTIVLATALSIASQAIAADPPNLVGTWKPVGEGHASVRHGAAGETSPAHQVPTFTGPTPWSLVIEAQNGRAFHGHALPPRGEKETFVGVIRHNGQRLVIAIDDGEAQGEFVGDQLELCFTDHDPKRSVVNCMLLAKQGS